MLVERKYYCCKPKYPLPYREVWSHYYGRERVYFVTILHPFFQINNDVHDIVVSYLDMEKQWYRSHVRGQRYSFDEYGRVIRDYERLILEWGMYEKWLKREAERHHTNYFLQLYYRQKCPRHKKKKMKKLHSPISNPEDILCRVEPFTKILIAEATPRRLPPPKVRHKSKLRFPKVRE